MDTEEASGSRRSTVSLNDHSGLPTTGSEARKIGSIYYFTGKSCKHGHVAKRSARTGNCVACTAITSAANGRKNAAKRREDTRRWRERNRERYLEITRQNTRDWHVRNPERVAELRKRPSFRAKRVRYQRNREMAQIRAMPPWLTDAQKAAINDRYEEAQRLTRETGVAHHVDHIEPLRGRNSCGLHVPWNLQVITGEENLRKGNRSNYSTAQIGVKSVSFSDSLMR